MPIIKSAKKAARQAVKRNQKNVQIKKDIKVALKSFKADPSMDALRKAQSEYDKAAKKGLIKKNTASRRKAMLMRFAKENGLKMETVKKPTKKTASTEATAKVTTTKSSTKTVKTKAASTTKSTASKATKTAATKKSATTAKKAATKKPAAKAKAD